MQNFYASNTVKRVAFIGSIYLLTGSCQPAVNKSATTAPANNKPVARVKYAEKALADSLLKYIHLTEFSSRNDSGEYVLYAQNTAAGKVGVIAITDSVLLLFQRVNQQFRITNRIHFANYAFDFKQDDLNGDGQVDFIVYGRPDFHMVSESFIFMNDGKSRLRYRPDIKLYGIAYDFEKKLVRSSYIGGVNDVCMKALYRWKGDSLRQIAGALLEPDPEHPRVRAYKVRRGKLYAYKTYKEAVFDTILFKFN